MKRIDFLKRLGLGAVAAVVAPKALVSGIGQKDSTFKIGAKHPVGYNFSVVRIKGDPNHYALPFSFNGLECSSEEELKSALIKIPYENLSTKQSMNAIWIDL